MKGAGCTWSKCVRTRRCQSLRKSVCHCYTSWSFERGQVELTIVLYLLIVLNRLSWLFKSVNVLQGHDEQNQRPAIIKGNELTIVTVGDQVLALSCCTPWMMLSKIRLWEISLTQPYSFSVPVEGLAMVAEIRLSGCV